MEFASVCLSTLLPKLARLLQDEYNLHKGAKKGIQFLYEELERTEAALREVGEVPREHLSDLVRLWARDVSEVSYDMEDIIDTFMVRVQGAGPPSKRSAKRFIKKMANIFTEFKTRRDIAQEIQGIQERVRDVAERRDRYKVDAIAPSKKTLVDPRLNALYTEATKIVGIEEAKEEVIVRLTKGDADQQERMVVSIAGFGGLGKTTLAKAVYDEIKGQFDCTAFVSVSRNPDAKKLLKDILYELHKGERHRGANLDEIKHLIDLVRDFLRNKRYLIVIDDIWDKEPWDEVIGFALMENNMRSRIITTTRIVGVAEHVGGCYRLKPLSDESSEMLFYGRIFGSEDKCPRQFSDISKKILKKCGGVPLAIVTTSSLLANKSEDIRVWNDVCNSIGRGLAGRNPGMDDMRKILLLSYYDLPSHLKTCLLYLSIFPEDYLIEKDRLIWRWVAEGFVQLAAGDQSFYEIGESHFNELLNRSLIQPADMDYMDGTPCGCRVHDTMLDLIISLSADECFATTVLAGDGMENKVRRLSLHNNSSSTTWATTKMPKLRSLTIFTPYDAVTPSISRYLLLRVLDLRDWKLKDLASLGFVGSLSHLRYLSLSSSTNKWDPDATDDHATDDHATDDQLPVEMGKLRFLQTLDLFHTMVKQLPSSVVTGLGQLMCLRGSSNYRGTRLPDGLKKLTSLEVLENAAVTSGCIVKELGHLTKLRVLYFWIIVDDYDEWTSFSEALLESLGKLTKVESLRINVRSDKGNLDGSMAEPLCNLCRLYIYSAEVVPTWIRPAWLPVLSCLEIYVRRERRDDIHVLGTLPCLRHLIFTVQLEVVVERCAVGADAFPRVVSCRFITPGGGGPNVVPCTFPRGAMPVLQEFWLDMTEAQLGRVTVEDLGLGHLPSLRSVIVSGVYFSGDDYKAIKDKLEGVREKLEQEAAAHPNHPAVRILH